MGQAPASRAPAVAHRFGAGCLAKRRANFPAQRLPGRLMRIDVNTFVGAYPFRRVPGTSPEALLQAMDRLAVEEAWVSHLPSVFWRDPAAGNHWLYEIAGRHERLQPVPAIHPGLPGWEESIRQARAEAVPAIRCDPTYYGLQPDGSEMRALAQACAAEQIVLLMAVRLEDARQRHPNDRAPELPAAAGRWLIRSDPGLRLVVTHADRGFLEEVHFGST